MIYLLLFLLASGLNILLGLPQWAHVLAGNLQDPDSYMRLLRLEQGVHAGHLVVTVAGDQSGAGVMVEWSRLLDIVLWLLAAPLAPFLGWHKAIFWAGVASGPIGIGVLGMCLAWAAEPLALRRHLWSAAAAAALLPAIASVALPGVVHYHVALLALIALTAGCVLRAVREDTWFGFLAGISGGFAIWMTPETMPFVLMAYGALAVRWLKAPNATTLLATASGCFDVLGVALFVDPPEGGFAVPEIDRLSYVYVTMALILMACSVVLLKIQSRMKAGRGIAGLAVMAIGLAAWIAVFPGVVQGPSGLLPPDEAKAFFGVITEQLAPRSWELVAFLLPGAWAVFYAASRAWRERKPAMVDMAADPLLGAAPRAPIGWLYVALCAAVALALGAGYLLFTSLSAIFAAGLLPIALSQTERKTDVLAGLKRISLLALVLLVPFLAARMHAAAKAPQLRAGMANKTYPSCDLHGIAPLLAKASGEVVLASVSDAPELLYRAPVFTVGSLYHHGIAGFMKDRAAWRAPPGQNVPEAVQATKAAYVLFCPEPGRYLLVADLPPDTLWDALEAGTPPPWLQPAGQNEDGWELYKITP